MYGFTASSNVRLPCLLLIRLIRWNRCALTNTKWMMGDKTCHFFLFGSAYFFLFLKYVAENEEKISSQNKKAKQTRLKSAHVSLFAIWQVLNFWIFNSFSFKEN